MARNIHAKTNATATENYLELVLLPLPLLTTSALSSGSSSSSASSESSSHPSLEDSSELDSIIGGPGICAFSSLRMLPCLLAFLHVGHPHKPGRATLHLTPSRWRRLPYLYRDRNSKSRVAAPPFVLSALPLLFSTIHRKAKTCSLANFFVHVIQELPQRRRSGHSVGSQLRKRHGCSPSHL